MKCESLNLCMYAQKNVLYMRKLKERLLKEDEILSSMQQLYFFHLFYPSNHLY